MVTASELLPYYEFANKITLQVPSSTHRVIFFTIYMLLIVSAAAHTNPSCYRNQPRAPHTPVE